MSKPVFHELPDAEYEALKAAHTTWKDVMDRFSQPDWCEYPRSPCWNERVLVLGRKDGYGERLL